MKPKTLLMAFAAMIGLTASVSAGNFNINTHLGTFAGGSPEAIKANVDYDGSGPLPEGVYAIKPRTDGNDWYLPDIVFVEAGATLIIEPGTTIYADSDNKGTTDKTDDTYGAIVVCRDAQIIAEGTAAKPIVITTVAERDGLPVGNANAGQAPVAGRDGGLWGGLVLLGNAPLTARDSGGNIIRETRIEGFADNLTDTRVFYGPGANPAKPEESSGVLSYMSLRFGGYEFSNGSEINGLTMGSVGRGTRIENIEVVSNTDDAFEWFGGTVNCRNLVAVFCNDDNLDMDFGFQGTVQNVLIVQNTLGQGADNGFELSGVTGFASTGTGADIADATKPVIFNVTAIGNGASNSTLLRTNSGFQGQIHNSVFLNYGRGVRTDDALTRGLVGANGLRIGGSTWVTPTTPAVNNNAPELQLYDGVSPLDNNEVATIADLKFNGAAIPVPASGTFNPSLGKDSPLWAHNGAIITKVSDIAELTTDNQRKDLQELPYQGAFGRSNWAAGWTYLSDEGFFDETPVVASGTDVNIMSLVAPNDAVKANIDYDATGPLPAGVLHLTADKTYLLNDILFVESGATLIIDPGTVIYCNSDNKGTTDKTDDVYGAILVARGGKIIAEGTAFSPIVMTAVAERDGLPVGNANAGQAPVAGRDGGLWGGLVLLGNAPLTARDSGGNIIRETRIEGFADNLSDTRVLYGPAGNPAKPEESSGVLSYMSLRFGGYEFSNGSEINGLTMGSVGRGTRIENIEVVSNTDDAFEWFGGTVNCRNLVAVFCNDDNLDMDFGFQGTVQNVLIVQNTLGQGADNAFELSGVTGFASTGTGADIADATKPLMFNVTAIGNGASGSTVLRTNSGFQGQIHNSVFLNYVRGVRTDDALTRGLVGANGLRIGGSTWVTPTTPAVNSQTKEFELYDGVSPLDNNEVATIADLKFNGAAIPVIGAGTFDPTLGKDSPLWGFNNAVLTGIENIQILSTDNQRLNVNKLPYQGAFGVGNWTEGWTVLTPLSQVDDSVPPVITLNGSSTVNLIVGDTFTDLGAVVTDNVDSTRTISGSGTVNTALPATYTLTYSTSDQAGNAAVQVTRTVIVRLPAQRSVGYTTSLGSPLNISNFFQTAPYSAPNTTVALQGKLPAGMKYNPTTKLITGYPTAAGQATFLVTVPGQDPATVVLTFALQQVPLGFVGIHTLHTDAGDTITVTITAKAAATVSILPAAATKAIAGKGFIKFNSAETDPEKQWTLGIEIPAKSPIPAQSLMIEFPTVRELKAGDNSYLGSYGTYNTKELWGFKGSLNTGTIVLRKNNVNVTISGVLGGKGVAWTITPQGGKAIKVSGSVSVDGIASIRALIATPNLGLLAGMLRVEEVLDNDGIPTGQISASLLQGFDGWETISYTAP